MADCRKCLYSPGCIKKTYAIIENIIDDTYDVNVPCDIFKDKDGLTEILKMRSKMTKKEDILALEEVMNKETLLIFPKEKLAELVLHYRGMWKEITNKVIEVFGKPD